MYEGLLLGRRLMVEYRAKASARSRSVELNPLGLVVRAGIAYLVATAWDYDDTRHFALHRMDTAQLLDQAARPLPGFRLADHIRTDSQFSYPLSAGSVGLKALFDTDAAVHLTESRLAADHRATEQADGRTLIEATVADTADLRWWLLGFGGAVEVLGPASLRADVAAEARRMAMIYGPGKAAGQD